MPVSFKYSPQQVARNYDINSTYWVHIWSGKKAKGLHHGYYDPDVKTHSDAVIRVNETVAKLAGIKPTYKVLDAGCGVGGTAIWIAKNIGANVTGITLSPKQVKTANKYAEEDGVSDKVKFFVRDYHDTQFESGLFDAIYGIESICYSPQKGKLLKELFRVLKPGGRIIVADGFQLKEKMTPEEQEAIDGITHNFDFESMATVDQFDKYLREAGFKNVKYEDKGKDLKPNLDYGIPKAKKLTLAAKILPMFSSYFKEVAKNYHAAMAELKAHEMNLWTLGIFYGEKPNK